jgi:hypothetical protein
MTRLILLLLLVCTASVSFGQVIYAYQDIKLEKPTDYKETEPLVLNAANYLLTTAFLQADENRVNALKFLSAWLAGTKDHSFHMQGIVQDINNNADLLSLYFAAMVKYRLENTDETISPLMIEYNACKLLLTYSDNPANNFKTNKKIRKLLEKNQAG